MFSSDRTIRILAATILLWTAAHVFSQAAPKVSLQGVVKRVGTAEPIAGARVTLRSNTSESPLASAITDEAGKFSLAGVDRGAYRIGAGKNGYIRYESQSMALSEQVQDGFVIHLKKTATVSGRVSGAGGKLLAGIRIKLLRRIYDADGLPRFSTAATVETNDVGEYRAYWITPGRYYLSASSGFISGFSANSILIGPGPRPFDGRNGIRDDYPETFFPGVMDIAQARAIDLEEGADVRPVDFTLVRPERFYSIRGRVIDAGTGQSPAQGMVFLGGGSDPRWYDPATGTFELPNMAPGRHGIMARIGNSRDPLVAPWVFAAVTLLDSNIDNLVLRIPPPVEGQIRTAGQLPADTSLEQMRVSLVPVLPSPADPLLPRTPSAAVAADGKFRISVPLDGAYRVKVSGLPAMFYVKEALLNDVNVLQSGARFSPAGRLEILLGAGAGEVSGRVLDDRMEPVRSGEVALVPSESRDRVELFKRTTVSNGEFRIPGVAPGDYKVFAWQGIEENAFFDTDVLKKFESRGFLVHVGELSRETVNLRLIPETVSP